MNIVVKALSGEFTETERAKEVKELGVEARGVANTNPGELDLQSTCYVG